MNRFAGLARRFAHLGGPTISYGAVGLSAFVLLGSGPRLLGVDEYSFLAIAWTLVTIYGLGIATPGEQTVTRSIAAGHDHAIRARVRHRLLLAAAPFALAWLLALAGWWHPLGPDSSLWLFGTLVAVIGWAVIPGPRGTLAGSGDFRGFSMVLGIEAALRVVMVGAAWVVGTSAAPLVLSLSMGVPTLIAAGAAAWLRRVHRHPVGAPVVRLRLEQTAITVVALAIQVVLSTAPLWLESHPEVSAATAGAFVSASSYMRVAMIFAGGIQAVVLSQSAALAEQGDVAGLRQVARHNVGVAGVVAGLVTGALLALSGPGLTILYGPGIGISLGTLAMLGLATVVFVIANVATQVFLGCRRSVSAALAWVLAAIVTTAALAILATSAAGAALAILIGVVLGTVVLAFLLPRAIRGVTTGVAA